MTLPDVIRRWQYGWGLAKGLAPAETLTGSHKNAVALKVTLDLPGRYQELVPLDTEHARYFAGVVARAAKPSWVSVIGPDPAAALADFTAAGLEPVDRADALMTIALAEHPVHDAPEGYTVEVAVTDPVSHKRTLDERLTWDGSVVATGRTAGAESADDAQVAGRATSGGSGAESADDSQAAGRAVENDPAVAGRSADDGRAAETTAEPVDTDRVIRVRVVTADGELAARGLMGVHGTDAVAHGITTEPAHRRRGLGSVVMSVLSREAIKLGADTGLLVAVPEGRYLYNKIGWSERADFVTGALPARD